MAMTLIAGLATGIGGAVAFFRLPRHESGRFLSAMLGFSGGVMVYISLVELMSQARTLLGESFGATRGGLTAVGAFAFGMLVTALIDKLVPEVENPHHVRTLQEFNHAEHASADERARLGRAGLLFTLAIGLHNFPEGLATLAAGLSAPEVGWPVTVAIALHNIPEGVAIAVPLVYATGNRRKAFGASVLAGLAEPAGALIGFLVLLPVLSPAVLAILFAFVAGVMWRKHTANTTSRSADWSPACWLSAPAWNFSNEPPSPTESGLFPSEIPDSFPDKNPGGEQRLLCAVHFPE